MKSWGEKGERGQIKQSQINLVHFFLMEAHLMTEARAMFGKCFGSVKCATFRSFFLLFSSGPKYTSYMLGENPTHQGVNGLV